MPDSSAQAPKASGACMRTVMITLTEGLWTDLPPGGGPVCRHTHVQCTQGQPHSLEP